MYIFPPRKRWMPRIKLIKPLLRQICHLPLIHSLGLEEFSKWNTIYIKWEKVGKVKIREN
jgi:hypothetical protein